MRPWSVRLWPAHLLGLVCVAIAIGMGVWQYDAWQERRAAERVDLTRSDPLPLAEVIGADDPFPTAGLGRPVEVRGTFLTEATVLVSGREGSGDARGADGRWVVTPLTDGAPDAPAIPVVRGWVSGDVDLAAVPPAPTGEVEVLGWLQPSETSTELPGGGADGADGVIAKLRIADLQQRVEADLYGAYVVAEEALPSDEAAGVVPATLDQLPPPGRFTGLRNILYAIEWWLFAAFAGFMWWRYVRDATAPAPVDEGDTEDAGDDAVPSKS